jgi:hypothetical protein
MSLSSLDGDSERLARRVADFLGAGASQRLDGEVAKDFSAQCIDDRVPRRKIATSFSDFFEFFGEPREKEVARSVV